MAVARMRTAQGIMDELKAADPNTAITLSYIRSIINSGQLPVCYAGRKKLVDYDQMLEFLKQGNVPKPATSTNTMSKIRHVNF